MKKILILLLVLTLSLGVFTGCDLINGLINPGEPQPPVDETPEVDYLPDAVKFLHNIYKEKAESTLRDFDVIGQVLIDGVKFTVTWTCDNEKVEIKTSASNPINYTVDLPSINEEEFSYTLTATVTAADGRSEQKSYTFKVPVLGGVETELQEGVAYKISFNQAKLGKRLFALAKTQDNKGKFILSTNNPKEAPDFFVEKVDGGFKFYTEINGVKNYVYAQLILESGKDYPSKYVGFSTENGSVFTLDSIGAWYTLIDGSEFGLDEQAKYGFGTYSDYDTLCISEWDHFSASSVGTSQYVAEFITSEYAETLTPDEGIKVEEPADGSTLTIKDALDLGVKVPSYTTGKFYVTGVIDEIYNTQYGNMYINDGNGNRICIYGTFDATGANRFDAMTNQPKVGDTITVYGVVGNYNGTPQMKNAWITNIVAGEGTDTPVDPNPETPTFGVVDPVAGTAYKFGMVQQNVGTDVYYLIGGMNGYYMATGTDVNAAIDVYLEETEGGYYLYTLDAAGAKLYINMVVSGTHVNGAYEATASTVYTYNTESKTLVASVQPEGAEAPADYWFGTRNDKTFTTVGPCAVSYAGFYCQFYGTTEGGNGGSTDTPVDPNPETPVVPEDGIYTIPQALAAAVGTKVIVKGQVVEVNQVWDTGYKNMSVTIADADGNELYVFRTSTQVVAGDFVTITGTVGEYNGSKQIAQGSTAEVTGHEDLVVDANCKTLSFADVANRTEFTTEKQVWAANGVTLTNNKADSTQNVADYSGPARFYANTEVVVECKGMTKIVFNLNSGKPASGLTDSLVNMTGITVEANGNDITIIFDSAVDSFTFSLVAQIRVDSIDVYTA